MRIRRRPQAQALPPLQVHHSSDPSTAPHAPPPPPNAPRNQQHWLPGQGGDEAAEEEGKDRSEGFHLHPNADLGRVGDQPSAARRAALPLLPQAGNVVGRSESPGAGAAQPQQRRQGAAAADGHHSNSHRSSLENGHRGVKPEPATYAGERLVNGVFPAVPAATLNLNVKGESKQNDSNGSGGAKKRRGPAVLMEGSRCSRVNGRGWRCSQPTLVGYSLCEHHLGKGRMRSSAAGRGGPAQLGRTEPGRKQNAATVAVVTTAVPGTADEPPSVRHC